MWTVYRYHLCYVSVVLDPGLYLEVSRYVDPRQNADGWGEEDGKHPEEVIVFAPPVWHQVADEHFTWDNNNKKF